MRRYGQAIGLCVLVIIVLAIVGLVIWLLSDVRFRSRYGLGPQPMPVSEMPLQLSGGARASHG